MATKVGKFVSATLDLPLIVCHKYAWLGIVLFCILVWNSLGSTSGAVFLPGLLLAIMGFTFLELLPDNTLQVSTSFGNPGDFARPLQ